MIYIFLADGFEELEAVTPRDILKRAKFDVETVGVGGKMITSALGLTVKTDIEIKSVVRENLEAIVLPGGMPGTLKLDASAEVREIVKHCAVNNILIGAICAAPMILGNMGLLKGKNATCFPGCEENLKGAILSRDPVCRDENIITSKGPGTALEFALALVSRLKNETASEVIRKSIQC
jgi:4-methyl-5(b-hydroxyethyl)-thiazole monophosphate biosynthesis